MTYTGRTAPGGPATVRELAHLIITKLSVGPMDNNAYLLRCRATGAQLLIDAAAEPTRLIGLVGAGGLETVVTTHRHRDHHGALAAVIDATGALALAHASDASDLPVTVDHLLADGDEIVVGAVTLTVRHLPGHTPGGIALIHRDPAGHPHAFTGDPLFPGGIGATPDPLAFQTLLGAVETRLFDAFPDETWVYPGHGHDTTLGAERPALPTWRARGW